MTTQIALNPTEILDLETLDVRQARTRVKALYRSIRSEKIRTFYCDILRPYFLSLQKGCLKHCTFAGVNVFDKHDFELMRVFGDMLDVEGIFVFVIGRDVTPDLAAATIKSISVTGFIFASQPVWDALQGRIRTGIHITL